MRSTTIQLVATALVEVFGAATAVRLSGQIDTHEFLAFTRAQNFSQLQRNVLIEIIQDKNPIRYLLASLGLLAIPLVLLALDMLGAKVKKNRHEEQFRASIKGKKADTDELLSGLANHEGDDDDDDDEIKHANQEMENKWREYINFRTKQRGSVILVAASVLLFTVRLVQLMTRKGCGDLSVVWAAEAFLYSGLVLCACIGAWCMYSAHWAYWGAAVFVGYLCLVLAVPPWSMSCRTNCMYAYSCQDKAQQKRLFKNWEHGSCGLQGITSGHFLLFSILLMPHLFPNAKRVVYVGFFFISVYVACSVVFSETWWDSMDSTHTVAACRQENTEQQRSKRIEMEIWEVVYHSGVLLYALAAVYTKRHYVDKGEHSKFIADAEFKKKRNQLYKLFEGMVPKHVLGPLYQGKPVPAEDHECVTVLFILIADFDHYAATKKPKDLLEFLNTYFGQMDDICAAHNVTKIETVAEEYVACVGIDQEDKKHDHGFALLRLIKAAHQILEKQDGDVRFKMGMQSGPITAGVIGDKLPRYRLVGDTINTAARMMQKGIPGELQFGRDTRVHIPEHVPVKERGEVEMKGKGKVMAYLLDKENFSVDSKNEKGRKKTCVHMEALQGSFHDILDNSDIVDNDDDDDDARIDQETDGLEEEVDSTEIADWHQDFHKTAVCKKLDRRLLKQATFLGALTLLESLHMIYIKNWNWDYHGFPGFWRFHIYFGCRALCILLILLWQLCARGNGLEDWSPAGTLWGLLITAVLCICLMFVSYDALIIKDKHDPNAKTVLKGAYSGSLNDEFPLLFSLNYFLMASMLPLKVQQGVCFFALACVLAHLTEWTSIYFSQTCQRVFALLSLTPLLLIFKLERQHFERFRANRKMLHEKARIETVLNKLMPPGLVNEIRESKRLKATPSQLQHHYEHATIAQSDLCGFTALASTRTPTEVVAFISQLFQRFDDLADKFQIYKVETVGDAYIAGQAEKTTFTPVNSPCQVMLFALGMIDETNEWARSMDPDGTGDAGKVKCRVGVHHGECVGGVVGTGMMRYHLFGHFMTALDTLEATSIPGVCQVSGSCKLAVEKELLDEGLGKTPSDVFGHFDERTEEFLQTSKGEKHEFQEVGGTTFLVRDARPRAPEDVVQSFFAQ